MALITAQALTTPEFSSSQPEDPASSTTGKQSAAASSDSTSSVGTITGSPQPAQTGTTTPDLLTIAILASVILSNVLLLLILLWKPGKRYLRNLIKLKSGSSTQETILLETIQNKIEKQQGLLQFMKQNQQTLLRKTEDMEQSLKRMGQFQAVSTTPPPRVMDNPQQTPRLSPSDHLVQVLEQGGDRAALAQWSAVKVRITEASQSRIHRGDIAGISLERAQAGASFLVFQVNGENLLVPNQETLGAFQRYRRGHAGLFVLDRQPSRPTPQVSKPARVQLQGNHWRVVEQGEVLIRG